MTEIEELIEAAGRVLKAWRPPSPEAPPHFCKRTWQEILDGREYDAQQTAYLASSSKGL